MTVITYTKNELIHKLSKSLNWSFSSLSSFKEEELHRIHTNLLDGNVIKKVKVSVGLNYAMKFKMPKQIIEELGLTYGDWFHVRVNVDNNEIVLIKSKRGHLKLGKQGIINFPLIISAKQLLKPKDDAMLILDGERIILKSFVHMQ